MGLYFLISGTLSILVSFGVFESILKTNRIKRLLCGLFLILSCILNEFQKINIFGVDVNLCMILYIVATIIMLFTQKTIKNYIFALLICLLVIAVLTFYNALNLSGFEFSYVQPYVYVAIFIGIIFNYVCNNFKSVFVGTFIGCFLFELLFYELSLSYTTQGLLLGTDLTLLFILVSSVSYCIFNFFICTFKALKNRKKEQKVKV